MRWWRRSVTRLILFLTGFVLVAAMVLNTGCATTVEHSIMSNFQKEIHNESKTDKDLVEVGWIRQDVDGYVWEYHARRRGDVIQVVAKCSYNFIRYRGVENWKGVYYNILIDFGEGDQFDTFVNNKYHGKLEGLAGCVAWVELFLYGDKFI